MVSGWELRLGGPNPRVKFTELSGVGDDLDRERRKKGARKQPVQQQSQPSRPLHGLGKSTAQAHWTLLAPVFDPLTTVSRRHSKTRPPSTTKARHPAFESQLHEYVDQQENDVTPVQEPHYPFPDPGACPPPIADPQPAAPMGHAGRATLPFYINGSTMDLHGTYTRSRLHSTVSRALGSLTRGGIHPKPPPGPGDQALMSLILDVNTKGKGNYKHLDFFAHIDDRLEGYNFCIGSREWNQIIAERPDYGLSPAASVPAGSSSFDLVDPGGPAAAVRAGKSRLSNASCVDLACVGYLPSLLSRYHARAVSHVRRRKPPYRPHSRRNGHEYGAAARRRLW